MAPLPAKTWHLLPPDPVAVDRLAASPLLSPLRVLERLVGRALA